MSNELKEILKQALGMDKRAFEPPMPPVDPSAAGGAPPMDPSMMGGAPMPPDAGAPPMPPPDAGAPPMPPTPPPQGAPMPPPEGGVPMPKTSAPMPMDPSMAGGAPPMDPAAAGGAPMPPPPPADMGGAPMPPPPPPQEESNPQEERVQELESRLNKLEGRVEAIATKMQMAPETKEAVINEGLSEEAQDVLGTDKEDNGAEDKSDSLDNKKASERNFRSVRKEDPAMRLTKLIDRVKKSQ